MKDEIISRSAVIAELECFKASMADVVLRWVVDRAIERVKQIPPIERADE